MYPTSLTSSMATTMKDKHMVNLPVETNIFNNYALTRQGKTYYSETQGNILPSYTTYKTFNNPEEERIRFHRYDTHSNPLYISRDETEKTVYVWSYNYQYPVAEIKNASYEEVRDALGYTTSDQMEALAAQVSPDVDDIGEKLRKYFKNKTAIVTTFTYEPGVGRLKEQDARGVVITYEYDDFNRLVKVKDNNGKTLEEYQYNFLNK